MWDFLNLIFQLNLGARGDFVYFGSLGDLGDFVNFVDWGKCKSFGVSGRSR